MNNTITGIESPSFPLTIPPILNSISIPNIFHLLAEKILSSLRHTPTPQVELTEEFSTLPKDIKYNTGYATGFVYMLLLSQNKKPSKLIVDVDEDLNEPKITLVFDTPITPEEEVKILHQISRTLLYLAEKENNDDFLDIHFIIRDSPIRGSP